MRLGTLVSTASPAIRHLIAIASVAVLLSACGQHKTETEPIAQASQTPSAPVPESPPPAPTLSQSDKEKAALEGCTATPVNTKPPSVDALESLQSQMRCVENFLDNNKATEHWQKAYAVRAKAMMASMDVINVLGEPTFNNGDADMANAQRMLMDREKLKKLKSENYHFVYRAIQEITISRHHGLFQELKRKGMSMGDPKEQLNASNRVNKQVGVWESSVDEVREGGQFIITRWVTEKTPMFLLEGYGTVSATLKVEDDYFDENGVFSDKCKVYIGIAEGRLSYPCPEYLTGVKGGQIIDAMMAMVKESMAKQANRSN